MTSGPVMWSGVEVNVTSPMSLTSPLSAGALFKVTDEGLVQNLRRSAQLPFWANGNRGAMAIPATMARAAIAAALSPYGSPYVHNSKPRLGSMKSVTAMRKYLQRQ